MKYHYLALTAVLLVPAPAAASVPDAWGQAAAHATGDHYNPGETRLTPTAAVRLKPRWSVPLATATCAAPATPLVGAGRLVTAAAYRISGHDATTGALLWQTPATTRKTSISLAAIVGTRLIAQYRDCRSGKTFLTAHDVTTGQVLYNKRIPETMYGTLADQGILVGSVWDAPISQYGLRAYRIADGSRAWARAGSIGGETIAAGGRILVVGDDSTAAVDVTTGRDLWTPGTGCFTPIGASPDGATFYMRCDPDGPLRRVDAATGKVLRTFPSHGATSGFATDGERVYLHTFANELIAVDASDGRRLWTATFAEDGPIEISVGGGVVYGWRDGRHPLAAFEARTGKALGLDAKTSALQGAPMVANGRLYGRTASAVTTYAP
ncbi:outer membrane protein assembly factor BamB family protein [Paractinoplanes atraurantiacus]|uniref:Outer membrane protein assembly factor BamB, contains PQQ-like beta-propeller repeat n=1 Tax=Paractinoplanes atraurantiacus TaxID=1036182 RepID=A0A285KET2_9ACTN|nr:PQQ-binding-like beta-propeller repeat protein [Actinoplanes atraurantiacus]SNY69916.1 Outer membrane protein assembly factor BamB, contains PQQ-like beta-propeller repeat [Actinoplanes atraurantiacus]